MQQDKVKLVKFIPLSITQKDPDNEENLFKLSWSVRKGYPRMTVYVENSTVKDYSNPKEKPFNYEAMLTAPFNALTVRTFLTNFQEVLDGDNDIKLGIECYNSVFKNGVKVDGAIALQAKAFVGKDKEGVMYLAVIVEGKRKAKMEIMPDTRFFKFLDKTGAIITDKGTLSTMHAKSYLRVLTRLIDSTTIEDSIITDIRDKPTYKTAAEKDIPAAKVEEKVSSGDSDLDTLLGG